MKPDRILYLDPFSGISGDMMIGALLDLGVPLEKLIRKLKLLPLTGYSLEVKRCLRAGISASKFDVHLDQPAEHAHNHRHGAHEHRNYHEIRSMIESSELSEWVKEKSVTAFRRLAEAEGKIHGQAPEAVHFHEVGAIDSIVDIVGTMAAIEELLPLRILSGPINLGHGTLQCQHGIYPVPGPATEELLVGLPTFANAVGGELTTPTGATLLATLVEHFGLRPPMRIMSSGYGAGSRETPGSANVLRATLGESSLDTNAESPEREVAVVETTIDDMNPQLFGYLQEKALEAGALDVYFTPIQMKKNRPAIKLTVVCAGESLAALSRLIFKETTTIGLRYTFAHRKTLEREFRHVMTEFGGITIKVSRLDGECVNFVPEYEDCRRLAAEKGIPLKEVMAAGSRVYQEDVEKTRRQA